MNGIIEKLKGLADKFPIAREQAYMQGMEWFNGGAYKAFAAAAPQPAAWLSKQVADHTILSRIALTIIGELVSKVFVKDPNHIANARIADFLVALQNILRLEGGQSASSSTTAAKEQFLLTVLDLEPAQGATILERMKSVPEDQQDELIGFLATLSPTRLVNYFLMDTDRQRDYLELWRRQRPAPAAESPRTDKPGSLLAALQKAGDALQARAGNGGT